MIILFIGIYLAGYLLAYPLLKKSFLTYVGGEWTAGSRVICLALSVFSWVSALSAVLMVIIDYCLDNDKPASW